MTRTTRILAIIGVAYLLAVAGLYFALFDRNEDFARNGETLTGTVQRVDHNGRACTGPWRPVARVHGCNVAIIRYTDKGETAAIESAPYSNPQQYTVGQQVQLSIFRAPSGAQDNVVTVKGHTVMGLRTMPWGFIAAAIGLTWYFVVKSRPGLLRRRRAAVTAG